MLSILARVSATEVAQPCNMGSRIGAQVCVIFARGWRSSAWSTWGGTKTPHLGIQTLLWCGSAPCTSQSLPVDAAAWSFPAPESCAKCLPLLLVCPYYFWKSWNFPSRVLFGKDVCLVCFMSGPWIWSNSFLVLLRL